MFKHRVLLAAAMVMLVAACGQGDKKVGSPEDVAALYRELATCYRAHGLPNFPEFSQDKNTGNWTLPAGTAEPPKAAQDACRSIADKLPDQDSSARVSDADMAKWRKWAQCMRDAGLADWPDPAADGSFTLPSRYSQGGKTLFVKPLQQCKNVKPSTNPKLKFETPPAGVVPSRTE